MERVAPVCTVPRQNRGAALATKLVFFLRRAIGGDASACERILDPGRGVAISKTAARALQCRFNYLELSPGMRRRIASMPHGRELLVSQVRTALVPTRGFFQPHLDRLRFFLEEEAETIKVRLEKPPRWY